MGSASKIVSVILRIGELVASVIVLGIVGYFLWIISDANIYSDSRLVYTTVIASLGTFFSIILLPQFHSLSYTPRLTPHGVVFLP